MAGLFIRGVCVDTAAIEAALLDLQVHRTALAQAMAEEVRRLVPGYAALPGEFVGTDLLPTMERLIDASLHLLREDAPDGVTEAATEIRHAAARRIRQGLGISDLLACVRVAVRVGHEHIDEHFERQPFSPATARAHREVSRRIWSLLDIFSAQCSAACSDALDGTAAEPEQALAALTVALLDGAFESNAAITAQARGLGVDLLGRHRLVVLCPSRPHGAAADVESVAAAVFGSRRDVLLAVRLHHDQPHAVAVVPERAMVAVTRALTRVHAAEQPQVVAMLLDSLATPTEVHAAYRRLRACLGVLSWEPPRLLRRADVAVYLPLSADMRAVAECVREVLGPLLDSDGADTLVQTLATYYGPAGCSKAQTATLLRVQARTVFNRLRRVKELTGLDPQVNGLALGLAVHLHEPWRRWSAAAAA